MKWKSFVSREKFSFLKLQKSEVIQKYYPFSRENNLMQKSKKTARLN